MLDSYETQEYIVPVAGRKLRLLGPKHPHALNTAPRYVAQSDADGYKPNWAQPWPAAVMLAECVIAHVPAPAATGDVQPRPALELGAGLGIVGLTLTAAGYPVIITDRDEDALAFIRASAALNGVTPQDVRPLDWRQPPAETFPLILGSDIIFDRTHHTAIVGLLADCLAPGGQALFSDQNRTAADVFPQALAAAGLTCDTTPARASAIPAFDARDGRVFNGRIFRIWRPGETA